MKQGYCVCPLSWSVHCNFTSDGKCNKRGWACTPHPQQPGPISPSSLNVRQKAVIATLCTLWCTETTSPPPTLFQCTQSTVCILQIRWCIATTSPTPTPFPEFPMGVQRRVSLVSTVLAGTSKSVTYLSIYFKFLKSITGLSRPTRTDSTALNFSLQAKKNYSSVTNLYSTFILSNIFFIFCGSGFR